MKIVQIQSHSHFLYQGVYINNLPEKPKGPADGIPDTPGKKKKKKNNKKKKKRKRKENNNKKK